jgi:hypothetical protein
MQNRRRFKPTTDSLKDRLTAFSKESRKKASLLPPGIERQDLIRKARQADMAASLDEWLNSPSLQPPK